MNDPVLLSEALLVLGRHMSAVGRPADARDALTRLLTVPDVPARDRAEAHRLLGDLDAALGEYRKARRHYAAAVGLRPDAATCLAYAEAVDADPDADPRRGWAARRRATRLSPADPRAWAALGRSGIRVGKPDAAMKAFRRAARLRPSRLDTLAEVVEGLLDLGHEEEARAVLTAARFRFSAAVLADLLSRFRYECLRREQQRARQASGDEAVVLKFPGRETGAAVGEGSPVVIRADRRSRPMPHLLRLFGMRGPRRAN